jgi:hypothetical protein
VEEQLTRREVIWPVENGWKTGVQCLFSADSEDDTELTLQANEAVPIIVILPQVFQCEGEPSDYSVWLDIKNESGLVETIAVGTLRFGAPFSDVDRVIVYEPTCVMNYSFRAVACGFEKDAAHVFPDFQIE